MTNRRCYVQKSGKELRNKAVFCNCPRETEKAESEMQQEWLWREIVSLLGSQIHTLMHNL